jgi:hypothetical protein
MDQALRTDTEFVWRKWDGSPHWRYEMAYLGSDEYGDWFGQRIGGAASRPGADIVMSENQVVLVPEHGAQLHTAFRRLPRGVVAGVGSSADWVSEAGQRQAAPRPEVAAVLPARACQLVRAPKNSRMSTDRTSGRSSEA